MNEKEELEWLNSKGYSEVKVVCNKCMKTFQEIVHTVRKKDALMHDTFFCEECSINLT